MKVKSKYSLLFLLLMDLLIDPQHVFIQVHLVDSIEFWNQNQNFGFHNHDFEIKIRIGSRAVSITSFKLTGNVHLYDTYPSLFVSLQFMDLRTRYTALVTLMTQYIKFAGDSLKRLEEEEVGHSLAVYQVKRTSRQTKCNISVGIIHKVTSRCGKLKFHMQCTLYKNVAVLSFR